MNMIEKIVDFIDHGRDHQNWQRSEWIYAEGFQLYLRKGKTFVLGDWHQAATIANICYDCGRGRGKFTELLKEFEPLMIEKGFEFIVIENIMQQRFAEFFVRQGYTLTDSRPPCAYKQIRG